MGVLKLLFHFFLNINQHCLGQLKSMTFEQEELWLNASERILWHEKLEGEEAVQNRVHE